jgi:protein-tyrosine phosphatase
MLCSLSTNLTDQTASKSKLIFLMAIGRRIQAISILGREVMRPRGLIGLGYDSIDYCGLEIAQAMREFATSTRYPILVHCTQGKDRTGLLVAFLLFLLNIPIEAITYDYTMSEKELLPEREARMVEIREIGLTEEFAGTPKEWIPKMKEHLDTKYGGVKAYLTGIGIDEEVQSRLVEILSG